MRTGGMIRSLIAAIVLAAVLPAIAVAQGSTDIITGLVVDEQDQPIEGAQVDATSLETEITRSARTDAEGRYTILFPDGGAISCSGLPADCRTAADGTLLGAFSARASLAARF